MATDSDILKDILEQPDFEPGLDASHIGVAVHGGVVTLTGHVPSFAQKSAAEDAVGQVRGVKAVAQNIEVELPSDKKRTDDEIAERALRILEWDDSVPSERIKVKVEHGMVTLTGEVDWYFQKQAAASAVHKLSGVVGVYNHITLRTATASGIREKIERAFERQAELDAEGVTVRVEGDSVILSGHVGSWSERNLANRTAWSAPGVKSVVDRITVG